MKLTPAAFGLLLAGSSIAIATPAAAQMGSYGAGAPAQQTAPRPAQEQAPATEGFQPKLSSAAGKAIVELQNAVNAKDTANIPVKLAEARAKAKSKDDKYAIGRLVLKAGADQNDPNLMGEGIEAMVASEAVPATQLLPLYLTVAKAQINLKAYDKAMGSLQRIAQLDPSNTEARLALGDAQVKSGRKAEGLATFKAVLDDRVKAGQKPEEALYRHIFATAHNNGLPGVGDFSRQLVAAYPSSKNWRDALGIYQSSSQLPKEQLVDVMRLAFATNSMASENDYYRLADSIVTKYPGEAKAVLEAGFAAKHIDKSKATFAQLYSIASAKSQGDRASLPAAAKTALAGGDPRKIMTIADAFYGYGDYAQAADLYKAALGKPGVDKDLANLRLGMSLARAGDKAGATAALNAAGGAQAEPAKFWLVYLQTKA